ncbi:prolyl oligopeptidase family serine peptidase [Dietzia sp. ANT_WB102]|uniref:prolyl oligopeptidase family serine peptidase n=1 Tax=Dietzia sp. ANT_WB102 TaxID=2597345 RepID=UPI0011EC75D7|nr:prolyl oligopeptidase family serine peptidase [Dietzia sp. ANT_WB102]KAA0918323.1 prolyl oligopeptidase family serine peptidase [Dietzia sp. ANT_WB102]
MNRFTSAALAVAVGALVGVAPVAVSPAPASADAMPSPSWSGLDTRRWDAPVPAPGVPAAMVPLDPALSLPQAGRAVRQAYGTIDQHGRNAIATSAVFLPHGTPPEGGWPVVAWAHGTTGLGDDCAPSTQPRSERDAEYLGHWLDRGYAVVAADYVGLGTPGLLSYLNGQVAARGIVDSLIAARADGLPLSATWGLVGQSQGAGAALVTATRATELGARAGLDYRGVVATGAPANIEHLFQWGGPGFPPVQLPTGLNVYAMYILAGFRDQHPEVDLNQFLTPQGREMVDAAETLCYGAMREKVGDFQVSQTLTRPLKDIPDVFGLLQRYMGTPAIGYDRPVFLGQGLLDTDVPAPSALSLAAEMTLNQQPLELHVYPDRDHSGTVYAATPDATAFLERVMR